MSEHESPQMNEEDEQQFSPDQQFDGVDMDGGEMDPGMEGQMDMDYGSKF